MLRRIISALFSRALFSVSICPGYSQNRVEVVGEKDNPGPEAHAVIGQSGQAFYRGPGLARLRLPMNTSGTSNVNAQAGKK